VKFQILHRYIDILVIITLKLGNGGRKSKGISIIPILPGRRRKNEKKKNLTQRAQRTKRGLRPQPKRRRSRAEGAENAEKSKSISLFLRDLCAFCARKILPAREETDG
jgi:hypothetical protein